MPTTPAGSASRILPIVRACCAVCVALPRELMRRLYRAFGKLPAPHGSGGARRRNKGRFFGREAPTSRMPEKLSAGLLMYRGAGANTEVLLAHPGGPFWAKKDAGAWSIPKGIPDTGEDLLAAARRE